jgi:hypothetical protein
MIRGKTMPRLIAVLLHALLLAAAVTGPTAAQPCTKAEIGAVIDDAGAQLRKLTAANQPALQAKLRRLAEAKGWAETDIEAKGLAFLQDDETRALDEQASQLLTRVDKLGDESGSEQEHCGRLAELRTTAAQLLEVSAAKSAHISARLEAALRTETSAPAEAKSAQKLEPKKAIPTSPASPPQASAGRQALNTKPASPRVPAAVSEAKPKVALAAPQVRLPPPDADPADLEYTVEDIRAAGSGFFGSASAGLASVIEYAFQRYGRPNGYVLGTEGGAALLAGLRYGEGRLVTKTIDERQVYWQGPSLGYDFGLDGSRVMFLVYNLRTPDDMLARFGGIDGSAYLVGGVGITFLKRGPVVLAPIRTGVGLRLGANLGYLKFTDEPRFNPF